MPEVTADAWEQFLTRCPDAHLLQTGAWGELKSAFGWSVARVIAGGPGKAALGAQILFRHLRFGYSLAYLPKGPVSGDGSPPTPGGWEHLWPEVDALCQRRKSVFLKVEPDLWETAPAGEAAPPPPGFRRSPHAIQPPRTLLTDLSGDEDHVLNRMKQKTRYNIRLALKKGVVVSAGTDLETFHRLMQVTGGRDAFGVHNLTYYRRAYELFYPRGGCELLVASYEKEPLAALMVFAHGRRAWYLYGASADEHRERMPTYLLQWEAMRWARMQGCAEYDLWGVPDENEPDLEANFANRQDGLWGVYRFKRGFGGRLMRSAGPWDRVYSPLLYSFYRWWMSSRAEERN